MLVHPGYMTGNRQQHCVDMHAGEIGEIMRDEKIVYGGSTAWPWYTETDLK